MAYIKKQRKPEDFLFRQCELIGCSISFFTLIEVGRKFCCDNHRKLAYYHRSKDSLIVDPKIEKLWTRGWPYRLMHRFSGGRLYSFYGGIAELPKNPAAEVSDLSGRDFVSIREFTNLLVREMGITEERGPEYVTAIVRGQRGQRFPIPVVWLYSLLYFSNVLESKVKEVGIPLSTFITELGLDRRMLDTIFRDKRLPAPATLRGYLQNSKPAVSSVFKLMFVDVEAYSNWLIEREKKINVR